MRPYFRQVAGQLVLGSLAGIVMNTAVVLPAIFLGRAIDTVVAFERGEAGAAAVGWAALAFVGATLATEGPRVLKRWWLMTANARIRANLRADALRGVLAWPMEKLHRTPVGDLMARIVGDVEVLGVGVREFTIEIWDTVLFSISLVVAMLLVDAGLTALTLLPVPAAMLLAHATGRWVGRRTTAAREANADLTAAIQEGLGGVRLLRLFGRAGAVVGRTAALSRRQAEANLATARLRGALQPTYTVMMTAGIVLLVWQGGERVIAGLMTVGAFVAYLELYLRFVNRGFRVPQLVNSIQSGAAAYSRLRPLLAPPLPVGGEPAGASFRAGHVAGIGGRFEPARASGAGPITVSLERVSFRYPNAAGLALSDVSLEIEAGGLVAITGPVGAGKSALARALLGLYPLEAGRVLLDGRSLKEIPPEERWVRTGYLPQEPHLFSGSVRENVLLRPPDETLLLGCRAPSPAPAPQRERDAPLPPNIGGFVEPPIIGGQGGRPGTGQRPAVPGTASTSEALELAVRTAALEADLETFPMGVETEIGELGIRVSGGQRQRIGLARAIAAAAPGAPGLLVLDDPFSAVDVETEAAIVDGLRRAFGPAAPVERRATIVLCSHRLAAFPRADLVVVLDRGRVVEQGSHEALMRADGMYARIYRAQQRAAGDGAAGGCPSEALEPAR